MDFSIIMKRSYLGLSFLSLIVGGVCSSCGNKEPLVTNGVALSVDSTVFCGVLNVYVDASSSVKGFVDVPSSDFKNDMPIVMSEIRNKLITDKEKEHYYLVKEWDAKTTPNPMSWDSFKKELTNRNNYNGQTTRIHDIIVKSVDNLQDKDVALIITDGVLSMGSAVANKSPNGNANFLGDLKREVKESMEILHKKDLDFAIMRTTCNYNGYYYCNCKELDKLPNLKDSILQQRPLFYIMMGQSSALSKMIKAIQVEDKGKYELSYFSNKSCDLKYALLESNSSGAGLYEMSFQQLSDTIVNKNSIDVQLELDYISKDSPVILYLCLPSLPSNSLYSICDSLGNCPNDFIMSATKVLKSTCRNDVSSCSDDFWKEFDVFYKIVLKSADEIRNGNMKDGSLFLLHKNPLDTDDYSCNNDIGLEPEDLQGRTFGWRTFMDGVIISSYKDNMYNKRSKIGMISINFKTK